MRKRRSYKKIAQDFNHVFSYEGQNRDKAKIKPLYMKDDGSIMNDEEIDRAYYHFGKADRTKIKKDAENERQRIKVREILAREV